jgi:hypothetical protein
MQNIAKAKINPNVAISLGYFNFPKNHNQHSKSSPIGKTLPNLVTLQGK